jgi:hypothetical protein
MKASNSRKIACSTSFSLYVPASPRKSRKLGIAKDHLGRQLVPVAQAVKFPADHFLGLFADGRSLEKQPVDLLPQQPYAPPFQTAHFDVKVAFQRVVEGEDLDEMAPTQLLRQCRNNSFVGELFGERHHSRKAGISESSPIFRCQLCRQCPHNPLSILPLFFQQ